MAEDRTLARSQRKSGIERHERWPSMVIHINMLLSLWTTLSSLEAIRTHSPARLEKTSCICWVRNTCMSYMHTHTHTLTHSHTHTHTHTHTYSHPICCCTNIHWMNPPHTDAQETYSQTVTVYISLLTHTLTQKQPSLCQRANILWSNFK